MIKKILILYGLILILILAMQTTTNDNLFLSQLKAQDYTDELGFGGETFCPFCNKPFDSCYCGSIDTYGSYYEPYYYYYEPYVFDPYYYYDPSEYGGGGGGSSTPTPPSTPTTPILCECCGKNPCVCKICRCCNQKECICKCPIITFDSNTYPFNGTTSEYKLIENWGLIDGGCAYSGNVSISSMFYSCSASMRVNNPSLVNDAIYGGNIKYYEDSNEAGISYFSPNNGSSFYDSSYTNIGYCSGTITRTPCQIGEMEVNLYYTVTNFFVSINNYSVYNHKYQITSQTAKL